jgi:hypothetical protein|tara:strand:+ start:5782 stop:6039 length:258 start_codon:yes stop_codon:yes gene_type:complete
MDKEEFLKKCDEVEDTAYAEQGHPQSFGNELLLQNIDAFGKAIADIHHRVKKLEDKFREMEINQSLLDTTVNDLIKENGDGTKNV